LFRTPRDEALMDGVLRPGVPLRPGGALRSLPVNQQREALGTSKHGTPLAAHAAAPAAHVALSGASQSAAVATTAAARPAAGPSAQAALSTEELLARMQKRMPKLKMPGKQHLAAASLCARLAMHAGLP
jgi:hypothetical protein